MWGIRSIYNKMAQKELAKTVNWICSFPETIQFSVMDHGRILSLQWSSIPHKCWFEIQLIMEKYLAQHVDGIEWSWSSWHPLDQSYTWASTAYNLPLTVNVRLPESLPRLFSRSSLYTPPSDLSASLIVRNACLSVTWDTKKCVLLGSISQSSSSIDCTNWKWTESLLRFCNQSQCLPKG